jgi:hypothetical protein
VRLAHGLAGASRMPPAAASRLVSTNASASRRRAPGTMAYGTEGQ